MVRHVIEWAFACENRSVTQRLRPPTPAVAGRVLQEPSHCPTVMSQTPTPEAVSCESRSAARRLRPQPPAVIGHVPREPTRCPTVAPQPLPLRAVPCENRPITQQLQPRTWSSGAAPRENRSVTLQPCPKHHIWSCGRREPAYCPKNQPLRMIPARIRCISSADESIPGPKTVYDKLGCIRTNGRGTPAWQSLLTRPVRFTASS